MAMAPAFFFIVQKYFFPLKQKNTKNIASRSPFCVDESASKRTDKFKMKQWHERRLFKKEVA